jgi:hypothetical protein
MLLVMQFHYTWPGDEIWFSHSILYFSGTTNAQKPNMIMWTTKLTPLLVKRAVDKITTTIKII